MEIDQIADALYPQYDRGPDEARQKARRAASWGKRHCSVGCQNVIRIWSG